LPPVDLSKFELPKERTAQIWDDESRLLEATLADYKREQDFLTAAVAQTADRITVVDKQLTQEEQGSKADSAELQRMITLLSKGQEINPRVTDARRALLLSSTRALQVNVELLDLKRQEAEGQRNIQRLKDGRRVTWLKELEEATAARTAAEIKVAALGAELDDSSKARLTDPLDEPGRITIAVVRQTGARTDKLSVNNDFELMPGDTIELTTSAPNQDARRGADQVGAPGEVSMRASEPLK
jgi:polysaccharide export outer membrane protein